MRKIHDFIERILLTFYVSSTSYLFPGHCGMLHIFSCDSLFGVCLPKLADLDQVVCIHPEV